MINFLKGCWLLTGENGGFWPSTNGLRWALRRNWGSGPQKSRSTRLRRWGCTGLPCGGSLEADKNGKIKAPLILAILLNNENKTTSVLVNSELFSFFVAWLCRDDQAKPRERQRSSVACALRTGERWLPGTPPSAIVEGLVQGHVASSCQRVWSFWSLKMSLKCS